MFNKLSIKSLGIIFTVLLLIVVVFMIYDSNHGERSFRKNLVSIDTSKVTAIYIYPKSTNHHEVKIFKNGNKWKVALNNNQSASIPGYKIQGLFSDLLSVKPEGIAASGKDNWKQYQVDTSGSRVVVFQGNDKVLNLIVGKFTFQQPRTMISYVRVDGDDNVYISNGFLDYSFNHNANYFRDNNLINSDFTNWNKLTFTYPSDSSFTLQKVSGVWQINGQNTDSAETVNFLRSLSHSSNSNFVDNPSNSILRKARFTLTIEGESIPPINISSFADSTNMVLNSSENPQSFFDGLKNDYWKTIFVGKQHFFKKKK